MGCCRGGKYTKAKVAGKRRNTGEKVTSGVLRPSLSSGNTQV